MWETVTLRLVNTSFNHMTQSSKMREIKNEWTQSDDMSI